MVNGDGPGVGTQLSGHPDVDMVSFTGSTRAGVAITKNAADSVKRVALELGGKGANIIFDDADEKAVARGVRQCFSNSGQSCNAPTRMLVQRSIYDERPRRPPPRSPSRPRSTSPPTRDVTSDRSSARSQWNKIQGLIATGENEGARLLAGGTGRPEGHETGYFVRPTIFADVTPDMTIAKEEIFGPVLSIMPFDTEEEAVAIANDTAYGLTNYVQTTDPERARRVARRLRSGMVEMNGQTRGAGAPFGGYGQSGNGREGGDVGPRGVPRGQVGQRLEPRRRLTCRRGSDPLRVTRAQRSTMSSNDSSIGVAEVTGRVDRHRIDEQADAEGAVVRHRGRVAGRAGDRAHRQTSST